MLDKTLLDALNKQVNDEFYSSYLYLSMSAFCQSHNLPGFSQWLKAQSGEEYGHALKIYGYVHDRGAEVILGAIPKPQASFKSILEVVEKVHAHEETVTTSINAIFALAVKKSDYATQTFLQWFVTEQVEEEKSSSDLLSRLKLAKDHTGALLMLDGKLGERK